MNSHGTRGKCLDAERKIARNSAVADIWSNPRLFPICSSPEHDLFMVFIDRPHPDDFRIQPDKMERHGAPSFRRTSELSLYPQGRGVPASLLNTLAFSAATVPFLMTLALFFAVL
jgi:hypothetical protein